MLWWVGSFSHTHTHTHTHTHVFFVLLQNSQVLLRNKEREGKAMSEISCFAKLFSLRTTHLHTHTHMLSLTSKTHTLILYLQHSYNTTYNTLFILSRLIPSITLFNFNSLNYTISQKKLKLFFSRMFCSIDNITKEEET